MKRTIILTESDVKRLISIKEAMRIVEEAFRLCGLKRVQMPAKIYLHLPKYNGDFRAMPAYLEEPFESCGLKWVNVHPNNRRFGLPAVMAVFILNDPKSGFPLSIMDATYLTDIRTGAAGGVAAKTLARRDSHTVALVGCGAQAQTQLEALNVNFDIRLVRMFDISTAAAQKFLRKMSYLGLNMERAATIEGCVKDADIIVTTTPSRRPLVKQDWVGEGAHINAIGADAKGKQELDPELLKRAKIVVDDWHQASSAGEINVPIAKGLLSEDDVYSTLGDIVAGKKRGRTSEEEITVFDSTGLAIQDVSVASFIYKKALKKGIGKRIELVGQ